MQPGNLGTLLLLIASVASCASAKVPELNMEEPKDDALAVDDGASSDETAPAAPPGATVARSDAFTNAPPYQSQPVAVTAKKRHAAASVAITPTKEARCLQCHGGTDPKAPQFAFAGTLYEDRTGAAPAKDVEIGFVDAAGKKLFVHSDEDGNFWVTGAAATGFAFPAYVSARMNDAVKPMKRKVGDATEVDCNSCHGSSNPITRP